MKIWEIINLSEKIVDLSQKFFLSFNNSFTNENISKIIKKQQNLTKKQLKNKFNDNDNLVVYDHKGIIDGVSCKGGKINLIEFSSITSKDYHKVNIEFLEKGFKKDLNIMENKIKEINAIIPTMKMNKDVGNGLEIKNVSMIKHKVLNNFNIEIKKEEVSKLSEKFFKEMQEKNSRFMEEIKWKDYEFFNIGGEWKLLHKDYIYRQGNIILYADYKKAIKITGEMYIKMCKEINSSKNNLEEYVNLNDEMKNIFQENYKIYKNLKKD